MLQNSLSGERFPHPQKSEGWLGLLLTAILCLGFLYWWFRPARETWQPHTAAPLVARALAEPGLNEPLERLVLDFDLMEVALLQARQGMVPEGLETASRIGDPVVQARTIRQLAQAHLQQDAKNLGISLTMCDRIADTARCARMKEEILMQILPCWVSAMSPWLKQKRPSCGPVSPRRTARTPPAPFSRNWRPPRLSCRRTRLRCCSRNSLGPGFNWSSRTDEQR